MTNSEHYDDDSIILNAPRLDTEKDRWLVASVMEIEPGKTEAGRIMVNLPNHREFQPRMRAPTANYGGM